jgi:hypothetical protein
MERCSNPGVGSGETGELTLFEVAAGGCGKERKQLLTSSIRRRASAGLTFGSFAVRSGVIERRAAISLNRAVQ